MMDRSTKARIAILVVILLATWAIEAQADLMTLTFDVSIHGRPCRVIISQVETALLDPMADAPRYTTMWECTVVEMDDSPPVPTPTVNPTTSPTISPTITPSTNGYVASINGTKFHYPDCSHARRILPANLVHFATREEAVASGRTPCGTCKP